MGWKRAKDKNCAKDGLKGTGDGQNKSSGCVVVVYTLRECREAPLQAPGAVYLKLESFLHAVLGYTLSMADDSTGQHEGKGQSRYVALRI